MTIEAKLDELLSLWQREADQGRDVPAKVLCSDDPHLAAELAKRIAALRRLDDLAAATDTRSAPFDQVASLCEDFTGEWDRLSRPSLGAYLARVGVVAQ